MKPNIRFDGFEDEWIEKKFKDIANRVNKQSDSNNLPKIEFEDIIASEGRLNKDVSNKFDDRRGVLFEPQNILFGKLRPYLKNWLFSDFRGVALGDFWVFQPVNTDPRFVYSLITSDEFQKIANYTSGTKMPRSDWKIVSSKYFFLPQLLSEQQKIGALFEKLDAEIAAEQARIDWLKKQKKGLLEQVL